MDKYKCICPNCHSELHGDEYDEVTEYHNSLTGRCNKCGHTDHWMSFFEYLTEWLNKKKIKIVYVNQLEDSNEVSICIVGKKFRKICPTILAGDDIIECT